MCKQTPLLIFAGERRHDARGSDQRVQPARACNRLASIVEAMKRWRGRWGAIGSWYDSILENEGTKS